jgi:protein involved in polysaccharide export with SLBB domain
MKTNCVNKKYFYTLLCTTLLVLGASFPAFSATLSSKTLSNDLNYYRHVSKDKHLDANGRHYILMRIENKYRNSKVNLSALKAEIRKLKSVATEKDTEASAAPASATEGTGTVEKILVTETAQDSRVVIIAKGIGRHNYFILRDPDPGQLPKIVLDLYGADDHLSFKAKDFSVRNGLFSHIKAAQFEGKPNNIVRVVAQLRQDVPYKVLHEADRWIILADKKSATAGKTTAPSLAPVSPTPSPAPEAATVTRTKERPAAAPAAVTSSDTPPVVAPPALPDSTTDFYRIDAGDIIGITVFPADEMSREVVVQFDGTIPFPLIGTVKARGLTPKQLASSLEQSLSRYLANPQVSITMKQFSRRQVFVTGEVRSVGAFNYKDNLRLMEFISSNGGFTENANRREVKVYRGTSDKRQVFTIDVDEVARSGDFSKDFVLKPGDIVEVPQGRARIAILGDVRSPGYYDYRDNLTMLELVSLAGGFTDTAQLTKVNILRENPLSKDKKVISVNLNNILAGKDKDVSVLGGDTIYVPKKNLAAAGWFINNILPWLSLVSLVFVIRGGV